MRILNFYTGEQKRGEMSLKHSGFHSKKYMYLILILGNNYKSAACVKYYILLDQSYFYIGGVIQHWGSGDLKTTKVKLQPQLDN